MRATSLLLPPRRATLALLTTAAIGLGLGGCGSPQPAVVCPIPSSEVTISDALQGVWRVDDHTGTSVGEMTFDVSSVVAVSGEVTYVGAWTLVGETVNGYVLDMRFGEADDHGVHEVFAEPVQVEVTLVFSSHDEVFALQGEGAWSQWTRVAP